MKLKSILFSISLLFSICGYSQGNLFGVKGGVSLGNQKWNSFERDLLFRYHGDLTLETDYIDRNYNIYSSLGYHIRGSAIRINSFVTGQGQIFNPPSREFLFKNISLGIGVKQKLSVESNFVPFYTLGLRLEYTVGTNFDAFNSVNFVGFYPNEFYLNKINYGFSAGGGFDLHLSEFVRTFLEFSVQPDVSKQYDQFEAIPNVLNPRNPDGPLITIQPQAIRNFSLEISTGIKFLQKIEYVN